MGTDHSVVENRTAKPVRSDLIGAVRLAGPARIGHYRNEGIPLRLLKFLATFVLAGAAALAYFVFFAGAQLTVVNASGVQVNGVEIDYGGKLIRYDQIDSGDVRLAPLGRLGGDVDFDIVWHEETNPIRQARFSLHLEQSTGYVHVRVHLLPSGGIAMFEGDRQVPRTP